MNVWIPKRVRQVLAKGGVKSILTKEDVSYIRECQKGDKDIMDNTKLWDKLFGYYLDSGDMPYGVAKARTGEPDIWILNALKKEGVK